VRVSVATAVAGAGAAELATVRFERLSALPAVIELADTDLNEGAMRVASSPLEVPVAAGAVTLQDTVGVAVPPRVFGAAGQDAVIPLFLEDDVTGLEVYSAQIIVGYRPDIIEAVGVDLAGTIGEGGVAEFNVVEVSSTRHEAHVSIAWVEPLEDCEVFANILVQVADTRGQTALDLDCILNEGEPAVRTTDGTFLIGILGDVNGSGGVSALDASLILQHVVGIIELPDPHYPDFTLETADVSGNGEIRAFDAALVLQYVLGLIEVFPAEELLSCTTDGAAAAATVEQARELGLRELARGSGWVDLVLTASDLRGVLGAELVLRMQGGDLEVIEVENLAGGSGSLLEHSARGDRLTIAAAYALEQSGSNDIARIRVADRGAGELVLESATLNEGRMPVELSDGPVSHASPLRFRLLQNVPNPFNPSTDIHYVTPGASRVKLAIYDASGRLVRVLVDRQVEVGEHTARWDGRDSRGQSVGAGVYFYTLDAPSFSETRKMILLK
jgi:hypothetical protein